MHEVNYKNGVLQPVKKSKEEKKRAKEDKGKFFKSMMALHDYD
jgi:hypothetical protein